MSKPIKPSEVAALKAKFIPDRVFDTCNTMIIQHYASGGALIYQKEVVTALIAKGFSEDEIFSRGYLNVEETYRKEGWLVTYDDSLSAFEQYDGAIFSFQG